MFASKTWVGPLDIRAVYRGAQAIHQYINNDKWPRATVLRICIFNRIHPQDILKIPILV